MREKDVERKLLQAVRQSGGLALKFVSPGINGVPDRLLLFMGGRAAFCEVKAPGKKPRPLQVHRMEQLRMLGFKVFVIDDVDQIPDLIAEVAGDKEMPLGCHPEQSEGSPVQQFSCADSSRHLPIVIPSEAEGSHQQFS